MAQSDYQRIRIYTNEQNFHDLMELGIDLDHVKLTKNSYIDHDFSPYEVNLIQNSGLNYEVLYANASDYYHQLRTQADLYKAASTTTPSCQNTEPYLQFKQPEDFIMGEMGGFFSYEEMLEHLDNMHEKYPDIVSEKQPINDFLTYENRPIHHVVLTMPNETENKKQILYTALHHAREAISLSQLIYFMYYILENYQEDNSIKYLLKNYELHFVPCINPDGYVHNNIIYLGDDATEPSGNFGFWRKNKRDNNDNDDFDSDLDGVDLNRNYGYHWAYDDFGSSPSIASELYRGPSAFSEPETQAMRWLCEQNEFYLALNYHSYGSYVIHPWGYEVDLLTNDHFIFQTLGEALTHHNHYHTGLAYETIGYVANGNSDDWMYGEESDKPKIFAFSPEVGTTLDGFYPEEDQIVALCQMNVLQNLNALRVLDSYGQVEEISESTFTKTNGSLQFKTKQHGLESGDFTINVTSLSPQLTIDNSFTTPILETGQFVLDSLVYTLDETVAYGQEIFFLVEIDNGNYTISDTLSKVCQWAEATLTLLHENACDDLNLWDNNGWGLTTLEYHSESASLTDSPSGNYENNTYSEIILNDTLDLSLAIFAELDFWAKWDLEPYYDYVQVIATNIETNAQTSLCGNYTHLLSSIGNEPIYHDTQEDWVQEQISLNDFLGEKIQLKFVLQSDDFIVYDGFYLDDVAINVLQPPIDSIIIATDPVNLSSVYSPLFQVGAAYPNPANGAFTFSYQLHPSQEAALYFVNEVGKVISQQPINATQNQLTLSTKDLASGIYFYYLQSAKGRSNVQKVVVH